MTETSVIADQPAAIDPQHLRHVLGSYPTGVAVVTGRAGDGAPTGMVVGTFSSVSMDPPLVSFMPMRSSRSFALLQESATFCVNILAADQEEVCGAFMRPGDKFAGLGWHESATGVPVLDGAAAWIECDWADVIEAGDHYFVLGAVRDLAVERECLPLLFFQRGYGRFAPGSLMATDHRTLAAAIRRAEPGRRELERLAADLGAEASLLAPVGDEFAFVATAGTSGASHSTLPGTRLPFVPPLGSLMVGTPGAPSVTEWLDRAPRRSPELRTAAEAQLRRAQERGWSVTLTGGVETGTLDELVDAFSAPERTPDNERRLLEALAQMADFHEPAGLEQEEVYRPLQVSVPVRDAVGDVVLVLRLSGLPEALSGARILALIDRLQHSASLLESTLRNAD